MPKLPGDQSKNRVTNLNSGSKFGGSGRFVVKKGAASGGSAKTGRAVGAKTGRFVTSKSQDKQNPTNEQYEIVNVPPNLARGLIHKALKGKTRRPAEPVTVRVYLDTDDAVTTVKVIKAINDVLASAGYGKTKIENVEKGSIRLRIKAWLDGEDGQKAQQVAKHKLGEAASYAEQWAKDATVNKQRAEVSAINAQTAQTLMDSVKDIDNIALQMDEWLIIKYVDASGKSHGSVRKLTVVELQLIERNPGLLNEPHKVLENLALLSYQEQHGQVALEG
jgi:hypothetical protein